MLENVSLRQNGCESLVEGGGKLRQRLKVYMDCLLELARGCMVAIKLLLVAGVSWTCR